MYVNTEMLIIGTYITGTYRLIETVLALLMGIE